MCAPTCRSSFLIFQPEIFNALPELSFSDLMMRHLPAFSCGSLASVLDNDINEVGELHSYGIKEMPRGAVTAPVSSIHVSMSLQDSSVPLHSTAVE